MNNSEFLSDVLPTGTQISSTPGYGTTINAKSIDDAIGILQELNSRGVKGFTITHPLPGSQAAVFYSSLLDSNL